ncbi:MAG: serine--tRNA ligase [Patescibacteria group bacterium]|jgi:seryl-tRNA synthetase|nr:serine--tRNA ligase [Patescibacteria group bacterium]
MIDIKLIREKPDFVKNNARNKGYEVDIDRLLELDSNKIRLLGEIQKLREKRNELSNSSQGHKPSEDQINKVKSIKHALEDKEKELNDITLELDELLSQVPNIALDSVPVGKSEEDNVVTKVVGELPKFNFDPKNHYQIALKMDWLDKVRAAKVAGSRFNYIKNGLVELQFGLIQFVFKTLQDKEVISSVIKENNLNLVDKAFIPILPPALIKTEVYRESARLDAKNVTYKLEDDDLWLNASAEHSLCTMYKDEILEERELPIRYIGYSTSFRREAGSYGKDMEGMFRSHQFDKLEMEVFSTPETGLEEHKLLIGLQEYLLNQLKIPYRYVLKCSADIGFPNSSGVDLEAWLPGQNNYRETHSADYMADFQSRRLKTRIKMNSGEIVFAHTNDATAIVLSRIPIAIIENYQDEQGRVSLPQVLKPYLNRDYL